MIKGFHPGGLGGSTRGSDLGTAPSKWSPTLNLKVGNEIFPIKKAILLEKLGLFQKNLSLLGNEEYEVQTKVSLSVFSAFVAICMCLLSSSPVRFVPSPRETPHLAPPTLSAL
jgi:hypothetical protein